MSFSQCETATQLHENSQFAMPHQPNELVKNLLSRITVPSYLSTEELANIFRVKPESVRSSLCRQGHYLGIRPVKLLNRRLAWPAEAAQRALSGEGL